MKLFVSALEPSSNLHLKSLLKELKNINLIGIFDKSIATKSLPLFTPESFSTMGFVDVLKKIGFFKKALKEATELSKDADKVLLIDGSGFNIPLTKEIKKRYPKKEIIYYILPQAWASRSYRSKIIDELCDRLCSIWPFELPLYSKAEYVGHPLLDIITEFKKEPTNNNTIAFLPGSRKSEITRLMPIFRDLRSNLKDKRALLVIPPFFDDSFIERFYGDISSFEVIKNTQEALINSSFAFICSGTATLESALIGTPFVLVYKARAIDFFIAKKIIKLKHVGLANIILDFNNKSAMHLEFFQNEVNQKNLLNALNSIDKESFFKNSHFLRDYLQHGSAKRVAKIIMS